MSDVLGVLVVDANKAALMMGGEVVAKCETKGVTYEIAQKVNSHDKLTEQNKLLREALAEIVEATEMLNYESGYISKSTRGAEDLLDKLDAN